jgi:anti-sigma factor RsiW
MRRLSELPLPPEPDCHQVGAVLQAYLDGELGPEDAGLVAAHLEHCERCEIESETVTKVIEAIRRQRPDLDPTPIDRLTGFVAQLGRGTAGSSPS